MTALLALSACGHAQKKPAEPAQAEPHWARAPIGVEHERDDGMKVEGTTGYLDPADIEEAFNDHRGELSACFHPASRGDDDDRPWLGGTLELAGHIETQDGRGRVAQVWVTQPLGDLDAEHCIVALAYRLSLPAPKGAPRTDFNYTLRLRPRQPSLACPPEQAASILAAHQAQLTSCAAACGATPWRLVAFVLPDGSVASAGFGADDFTDERCAACVVGTARTWNVGSFGKQGRPGTLAPPPGQVLRVELQIPGRIQGSDYLH